MLIKKSHDKKIFFIRLKTEQTYYWHYVSINKTKAPLLDKIAKDQAIDVKEFGEILDSGFGLLPPKNIQAKYPEIKLT